MLNQKTIENSSFQTLEALAAHLSKYIIKYYLTPLAHEWRSPYDCPHIHITLEKPTAVTFADAPMIEIRIDTTQDLVKVSGSHPALPFPLQGRLEDWISENCRDEAM